MAKVRSYPRNKQRSRKSNTAFNLKISNLGFVKIYGHRNFLKYNKVASRSASQLLPYPDFLKKGNLMPMCCDLRTKGSKIE